MYVEVGPKFRPKFGEGGQRLISHSTRLEELYNFVFDSFWIGVSCEEISQNEGGEAPFLCVFFKVPRCRICQIMNTLCVLEPHFSGSWQRLVQNRWNFLGYPINLVRGSRISIFYLRCAPPRGCNCPTDIFCFFWGFLLFSWSRWIRKNLEKCWKI